MKKEFAEERRKEREAARKQEIKEFMEAGVKAGTLPPAWKDAGISEFMGGLDAEGAVEFSEGKDKETPYAWFKSFLEGLPKVVEFREVAGRDTDVGAGGAGAKIEVLIRKKREANPELGYGTAFSEVQVENPALAAEYAQEVK